MSMSKLLRAYAHSFVSLFIKHTVHLNEIRNIILFGSVARGEASSSSDVDIFIELSKPNKKIENELTRIKNDFFDSIIYKQYWKLLGVENDLNIISGTFNEWKGLKNSIISNGILMDGRFVDMPDGRHVLIASFCDIKPNSKRVFFNKKIFGYTQKERHYDGLLDKYNGKKVGKGVILVPIEAQNELKAVLTKFKVKAGITKVVEYGM